MVANSEMYCRGRAPPGFAPHPGIQRRARDDAVGSHLVAIYLGSLFRLLDSMDPSGLDVHRFDNVTGDCGIHKVIFRRVHPWQFGSRRLPAAASGVPLLEPGVFVAPEIQR